MCFLRCTFGAYQGSGTLMDQDHEEEDQDQDETKHLGVVDGSLLILPCIFNHHDVKLKYDKRSAFLCNSK